MGTNINMRSSNPKLDEKYREEYGVTSMVFSRAYNGFGCSHFFKDKISDLEKIQNAYDIDLSPFIMFNNAGIESYIYICEANTEWELSKAQNEEEKKIILTRYEKEIVIARQKEADELKNNWVDMGHLKSLINEFLYKINKYPERFDKIILKGLQKHHYFNSIGKEVLSVNKKNSYEEFINNNESSIDFYKIEDDFELMLNFIEYATKRNENKISFFIM